MKKPTETLLCHWIKTDWVWINTEVVVKRFKKGFISNSMNRTEDYFCHLESEEEAENREAKREEDDNSEEGDSTRKM